MHTTRVQYFHLILLGPRTICIIVENAEIIFEFRPGDVAQIDEHRSAKNPISKVKATSEHHPKLVDGVIYKVVFAWMNAIHNLMDFIHRSPIPKSSSLFLRPKDRQMMS